MQKKKRRKYGNSIKEIKRGKKSWKIWIARYSPGERLLQWVLEHSIHVGMEQVRSCTIHCLKANIIIIISWATDSPVRIYRKMVLNYSMRRGLKLCIGKLLAYNGCGELWQWETSGSERVKGVPYRFRSTARRSWRRFLSVVLLLSVHTRASRMYLNQQQRKHHHSPQSCPPKTRQYILCHRVHLSIPAFCQ